MGGGSNQCGLLQEEDGRNVAFVNRPTSKGGKLLAAMNAAELEEQANLLLYGQPRQPVRGRGIESVHGIPNFGVYLKPKNIVLRRKDNGLPITCRTCGRLRSNLSGQQCLACYMNRVKGKRNRKDIPLEEPEYARGEEGELVPVYRTYEEDDEPS